MDVWELIQYITNEIANNKLMAISIIKQLT